jgi:hypothetical protein
MVPVAAATGRSADASVRRRPCARHGDVAESAAPSRALVPLTPAARSEERRNTFQRPSAAFLAQLIAASRNLPQARERRRAEPHEVIAAYASAARAV